MNILFGLAIVLVLMLGENSNSSQWIGSDETRVALLILLTAIPPLFAAGQVCLFHYRFAGVSDFESKRCTLSRFAVWHFAVWLTSSVAIVVLIQWQFTVRNSWNLDRFPAIDEMLILAPSLVSLIMSWFILFETQSQNIEECEIRAARNEYVSLRCKIYLLVALVPIMAMILVKDFWYLFENLPMYGLMTILFLVLLTLLATMPWLVGKLWSSRSVSELEGRTRMLQLCKSERMNVNDILVWNTHNSVVNALVAGVFPRYRVLMLSDLLLNSFPDQEVDAILRHEAGHLRLAHLPTRLSFILIPVAALVLMELDPNKTMMHWCTALTSSLRFEISPSIIPAVGLISYMLAVTAWLSRMMEFEADLYAAGLLLRKQDRGAQFTMAKAMCDALFRFAEGSPEQLSKSSLTHPSLEQRVELIKKCSKTPSFARWFYWKFRAQQAAFGLLFLIVTGLMLWW